MASLLSPTPSAEPGRISQLLPSVKCSSCNEPVPVHELGDHVCKPPSSPALSKLPEPPSPSLSSFFQNLVTPARSPTPKSPGAGQQNQPPPPPSPGGASSKSDGPSARRKSSMSKLKSSHMSTSSIASSIFSRSTRDSSASHLFKGRHKGSADPPPKVPPLPNDSLKSPPPTRTGTPAARSPSPLGAGAGASRGGPLRVGAPTASELRAKAESSLRSDLPEPPFTAPPTTTRARTPSNNSAGSRRPARLSTASTRSGGSIPYPTSPPSHPLPPTPGRSSSDTLPPARPSLDAPSTKPSFDSARPPRSPGPGPSPLSPRSPQPPPPQLQPHSPYSPRFPTSPAPPQSPPVDLIDTQIGGEAGMAGVGRRGFAAVARAAMFTAAPSPSPSTPGWPGNPPAPSMDGRRANAPTYLEINNGTNAGHPGYPGANTPPLSAGSGSGSRSPYSPTHNLQTPSSPSDPALIPPRTSSPSSTFSRDRLTATPTPADHKQDGERQTHTASPRPMSDVDSASEYSGLAYANDTDEEEGDDAVAVLKPTTAPLRVSKGPGRVRFPSVSSNDSERTMGRGGVGSPPLPGKGAARRNSDASASTYSRNPNDEDGVEPSSEFSPPMPIVPLTKSATTQHRGSTAQAKLPVRSHTSPNLQQEGVGGVVGGEGSTSGAAKRKRSCVKCGKALEDGRWIKTDSGSVLCERCWKHMYLPKCRRCNLPIEKHAVSSSDGQLKGKYHRECFNCHTCHKPFPDKTFYVFDGKPFCAYHYHEANDSLCAATLCGQPIEGPCAVSHTGDRYHPEHLTCEWPGGCSGRLDHDYWELDGRMLCEKHAFRVEVENGMDERDMRATKRTTMFIDLSALGGGLR